MMKNKLYNYQESAPENAWQNIANKLDSNSTTKKDYYWAIFAMIFLGISILVFTEVSNKKDSETYTKDTVITKQKSQNTPKIRKFSSINQLNTNENSSYNTTKTQHKEIEKTAEFKEAKKSNSDTRVIDKRLEANKYFAENLAQKSNLNNDNQYFTEKGKDTNAIIQNQIVNKTLSSIITLSDEIEMMFSDKKAIVSNAKSTQTFEDLSGLISFESVEIPAETSAKKWKIQTYFSPIIIKSAQQESAMLDELKEYHNKFENNSLFGASIAYTINSNWVLKSGIEYFSITQTTDNVSISPIISMENNESNIAYSNHFIIQPFGENANNLIEFDGRLIKDKGTVTQQIAYAGIPMQAGYKFFGENKLNLYGTAGIATYFLTKNTIAFNNNTLSSNLGEANNLNSIVLGTQAGFEFQYKLSNKISANIQPQIKYLLNTINSELNTKPVIIGISAGISYDF